MAELFGLFIGFVAVLAVFSIPLTAIITAHIRKKENMRLQYIDKEIELERLRLENYERETDKLRLELQQSRTMLLEDKETGS